MTDLEFGIRNAGIKVWPGSTWNLCWFHVLMNSGEKMVTLKIPSKIQKILKSEITSLHENRSVADANMKWNELQKSIEFLKENKLEDNTIRQAIAKW